MSTRRSIRSFGVATCSALAVLAVAAVPSGPPVTSDGPAALMSAIQTTAAPTPPKPKPKPAAAHTATRTSTCSAGLTRGAIGGVAKCLGAGQQCQSAHAADYTKYGFTCSAVKGTYRLSKKGTATKRAARPAAGRKVTPKPATTTPKPAPKKAP